MIVLNPIVRRAIDKLGGAPDDHKMPKTFTFQLTIRTMLEASALLERPQEALIEMLQKMYHNMRDKIMADQADVVKEFEKWPVIEPVKAEFKKDED